MSVISEGLVKGLSKAGRVTVLTGAGISQESGLLTFRDAQVGLWSQYRPEELATPEAFSSNPQRVWDWYAMRREKARAVQPNPGHDALAAMQDKITHLVLITQNVDGLHQRAGSRDVVELHGNIERVKCSVCGLQAEQWAGGPDVPHCEACAGLLRPDVVWFGEKLPDLALRTAIRAASLCEVFFSIGTSGLVQPAASLFHTAKDAGAVTIVVNPEPTPVSSECDFFLQGKSGEVLPELIRAVWPPPDQPM